MIRLLEKKVTIKCLEKDLKVVESIIPECE